jgi:hypothetical protein
MVRSAAASSGRKTPENSVDMFGHPWPEWFRMRDVGYEHIAKCARARTKTNYADLWTAIGHGVAKDPGSPWRQLPNLLGYIGDLSNEKTGLTMTALVVYREGEESPGPGFFRLAASQDLIPEQEAPPVGKDSEWQMTAFQRTFWEAHCDALYEYFSRNP